jgi:hypothetical protein
MAFAEFGAIIVASVHSLDVEYTAISTSLLSVVTHSLFLRYKTIPTINNRPMIRTPLSVIPRIRGSLNFLCSIGSIGIDR